MVSTIVYIYLFLIFVIPSMKFGFRKVNILKKIVKTTADFGKRLCNITSISIFNFI